MLDESKINTRSGESILFTDKDKSIIIGSTASHYGPEFPDPVKLMRMHPEILKNNKINESSNSSIQPIDTKIAKTIKRIKNGLIIEDKYNKNNQLIATTYKPNKK